MIGVYKGDGYQCNETNVMHFSFSLLSIKGLYIFKALLAHSQEALQKRHGFNFTAAVPEHCI
jgi:hypothetical protein